MFDDFREQVCRLAADDEATEQFRLAVAYAEAGMIDESMRAFERSAQSPRHRFEAAFRLGRLYREQGKSDHAVWWLERAAEVPAPTAETAHALLYELGDILETAGDTRRALAVFSVLERAGGHRDVAQRIQRLLPPGV